MKARDIKLGTIGSGFIVKNIIDAVKDTDGISLCSMYSRDIAKARKMAGENGASKAFDNLEEFFSDIDIDIVYIASPNSLHFEQTKVALEHGKHVICEKPMCANRERVIELKRIAEKKGLFLFDAVTTAYLPNLQIIKNKLMEIGQIRLVISNYGNHSLKYDQLISGKIPNVFNNEYEGGCLMDMNFYNIWLNIALFGCPNGIRYFANMHEKRIDISGTVVMEYDGFVSTSSGAKDSGGKNFFFIQGENGSILIPGGSNELERVEFVISGVKKTILNKSTMDRWHTEISSIVKMYKNGNYEEVYKLLDIEANVADVLADARNSAGIKFPLDLRV